MPACTVPTPHGVMDIKVLDGLRQTRARLSFHSLGAARLDTSDIIK